MKIGIVVPFPWSYWGGVVEHAENQAAALREGGPAFVLVKVTAEEQPASRIPYPPEEIRDRFRDALAGAAAGRR